MTDKTSAIKSTDMSGILTTILPRKIFKSNAIFYIISAEFERITAQRKAQCSLRIEN